MPAVSWPSRATPPEILMPPIPPPPPTDWAKTALRSSPTALTCTASAPGASMVRSTAPASPPEPPNPPIPSANTREVDDQPGLEIAIWPVMLMPPAPPPPPTLWAITPLEPSRR